MSTTTAPAPRPSLTSFWHDLPREGKLLLSVVVFEFLGTGLVLPFHVVYLHEVRHFALGDVGLLLGAPAAGRLPRRRARRHAPSTGSGARRILLASLVLLVAGDVLLAFATTLPVAGLALVLSGVAFGVSWPASQSLIARGRPAGAAPALLRRQLHPAQPRHRHRRAARRRCSSTSTGPAPSRRIYLADAVSYLPALSCCSVPLRHVAGRPAHDPDEHPAATYLEVLRRPAVRPLMLLGFLASFVGYSQLNVGMPAYARRSARSPPAGSGSPSPPTPW